MTSPASALTTPTPSAPIPDFVDTALHFPDLVSPSYWLLKIIETVCGVNPVEWIAEHFAGDWERMSTASSALENLAEYHEKFATELDLAITTMGRSWGGEASAAATSYLLALAEAVESQREPLEAIASEVDTVAQGMKSFQDMIEGLIGVFLDWAIAAAVSAAAAAASSWTIIGGIAGGAAAAASIAKATKVWMEVIQVHGYAVSAMDGLVGLASGFLGSVHGFSTNPLPAGAYNNPRA